ncbi:arginine-tRNA-protein transferase [Fennellomyces sp. T-0311]|nr:arginine-tRNA-protein transferase [Fennellomyces sp. T-0311]
MSRISPIGRNNHSCGYCHSTEDTSYTYGMWAHSLTCEDYQSLIDRGWRRSGSYCYKPDLSKSCCPQYTIRLDAKEFKPTKSQRKVINKFNRYIEGSWKPNKDEEMDQDSKPQQSKVNYDTKKSLIENIHQVEQGHGDYEHKFEVVLEPSSMTKEKFEVYRKYQVHIHNDEYADVSERSFKRFLIDTPLVREKLPNNNKNGYGSFHQKYILDGQLIAVAVLDILPKCVSSVYFMYDPEYAFLGLGKYSALREISLTQELSQSVGDTLHWYYMGFYIHSCPKMNYKGSYQPSDLLDAETYRWYPIHECKKLLDKKEFTVFSDPEKEWKEDRIPGTLHPTKVKASDAENTYMLIDSEKAYPVTALVPWYNSPKFRDAILEYIAIVGPKLAAQMMLD